VKISSVKNREKLQEQCKNSKVNLNMFGLSAISYDLLVKYPDIAKDYLSVEVDTTHIFHHLWVLRCLAFLFLLY
jgi:hypothetical protein